MKKASKTEDLSFILGSLGAPDYLVVAAKDGAVLGIKPLMDVVSVAGVKGVQLSFRVRSAKPPESLAKVAGSGAASWAEVWPSIQFDKINSERASTVVGVIIPTNPFKDLEKFVGEYERARINWLMVQWVADHVPGKSCIAVTPEALAKWVKSAFEPLLAKLHKAVEHHQKLHAVVTLPDSYEIRPMHQIVAELQDAVSHAQAEGGEVPGPAPKAEKPKLTVVADNDEDGDGD